MTKPIDRPGRGFIFKNRKKKDDRSPDGRGKVLGPDGKPLSAAVWEHEHGWSIDLREWQEPPVTADAEQDIEDNNS